MDGVEMRPGYGAYGKMPALGDFFRSGLSPGFVAGWDGWLQQVMPAARVLLGARWTGCYMAAPIWRFSLGPGLAGALPALGVMMPSIDRIGRQFPLVLASVDGGLACGVDDHLAAAGRFAALEALALLTLDEDLGRDGLVARLARLGTAPAAAVTPATQITRGGAPSRSFWSAEHRDGLRLLGCAALPDEAAFAAMIDPDAALWQEAGA